MDTGKAKELCRFTTGRPISFTRDGHLLNLVTSSSVWPTVTNTRGHTTKIYKPWCHLDLRRSFFSYRVIDRWNELPQSVIDSGTINTFKNGFRSDSPKP